jgi:hypothetical protein
MTVVKAKPEDFLQVVGTQMCLGDQPIILKGACLGGWSELKELQ